MYPISEVARSVLVFVMVLAGHTIPVLAQAPEDQFYKAFYLEHARHDVAAAAELYGDVVGARGLSADLQTEAKLRLAVCREELASADFARLMPPEPLAYVEINRPGERLSKLLGQLGLLREDGAPAAGENRLAISPAVIDALLGMRGLAVAVTGFDPAAQRPTGVLVLHPGDMALVRGLIETALPVGCDVVSPIGGYPTYQVEGFYVTLTKRLVIAASGEMEIEDVIDRLKDPDEQSLATNAELAAVLRERDGALLFFCVNPKPLLPIANMMLKGAATQSREFAIAQALLDPQSLRALSGRFDLSDQGLLFEITLRLDKDHRNLVYNFLRRPGLDPETLRCVPAGAAAFLALAMNDAPADYPAEQAGQEEPYQVVTALDFGRELFANINGIAVHLLPSTDPGAPRKSMMPIPDVAAIITVNDPAKSHALWTQILGLASLAAGAPTMEGRQHEVAGVPVTSYCFEDMVTIHVATLDHDLFIATTDAALGESIEAKRSGRSVLDDPAFAEPLARLGSHTTLAMFAHPGRCIEVAKPYMSQRDLEEIEPIAAVMTDTAVLLTVKHSDQMLRLSAALTGVPDVGELVTRLIKEQRRHGQLEQQVAKAVKHKDWDQALAVLDEVMDAGDNDVDMLRKKFDLLATRKNDHDAARALADELFERLHDNALTLNNFAWALLTEERYGQEYSDVALRFSRRSNQITANSVWAYVDTLALAEFETGNAAAAIKLEEQAIKLCEAAGGDGLSELKQALERFQDVRPQ